MLKYISDSVLVQAFTNINALLNQQQKKKGIVIFFLVFINAFTDVLGLGMIYPLIDAALNPELIQEKFYFRYLYDIFKIKDSTSFILLLSWLVFFIITLKSVVNILITFFQSKYTYNIALGLNERMLQYYYSQGYLFLKNKKNGEKIFNIKTAPEMFAEFYFMFLLRALTELVVILFICGGLLLYQPQILLLFLFIVLPLFMLFFKLVGTKVKQQGSIIAAATINSDSVLLENVGAFIDVILANKERKFSKEFIRFQQETMQSKTILSTYNTIPKQMRDLVLIIGIITILSITWLFDKSNSELISTLSIFALCAYRLIPAIGNTSFFLVNIKNYTPLIQPILVLGTFPNHSFKEVQPLLFNKSLSFRNISFSFPDDKSTSVLKNLSFTVKKGEKIGVIGTSGSGKTTFLNILLRLLREDNGYITIDGQPLKKNMDAAFQKSIGYVQQEVFIKNGTLQENIAFGEDVHEICKDRMHRAIKDAMLLDFTKDHPKGINMMLGENGVRLSGGQKQRVGIARVLYKQAQILVLDEPTSALDMETEHAIMDTIQHLTKTDKTIFIVAHRISTLSTCNRIYELEDGQIVRTITYKELFEEKMVLS